MQITYLSGGNQVRYNKYVFFNRFYISEAVNINFDPCLYLTLLISADTDVSGKLSGSAMSAEVEFQVDVFGVSMSKKNPLSQNLHSVIYNRHRFPHSVLN